MDMPYVTLPGGEKMPAYGHGTWHMGENRRHAAEEEAALRLGIELGVKLIDTAEMYGNGVAEEIVARAMAGRRDELFIVSKVLPYNASRRGTVEACERSLKRLKTDRIDLYLLHWQGSEPFAETLAGFDKLQRDGKIRGHGVSNFGLDDLTEWVGLAGGATVASNQILYNLTRRGPEYDLIPWCCEHGIPTMAYSPIEQGRMLGHKALAEVAARHGATPAQVALAWLIRQEGMIVIPKARQEAHLRDNLKAPDLVLTDSDLAALDRCGFPPPKRRTPLGMLYEARRGHVRVRSARLKRTRGSPVPSRKPGPIFQRHDRPDGAAFAGKEGTEPSMNVREAVAVAKQHLGGLYAGMPADAFRLDEFLYDDHLGVVAYAGVHHSGAAARLQDRARVGGRQIHSVRPRPVGRGNHR